MRIFKIAPNEGLITGSLQANMHSTGEFLPLESCLFLYQRNKVRIWPMSFYRFIKRRSVGELRHTSS